MNNKFKTVIATVALLATLAACSSSDSADSVDNSAGTVAAGTESTTQVTVQVDQDIKDALNVEAGSAVIPGSIASVTQELGEVCTEAVAPIRENYIAKFPSIRQVTEVPSEAAIFTAAYSKAQLTCKTHSEQEWSDFYTKEFAGWMTAKTDDVAAPPAMAPETTVAP